MMRDDVKEMKERELAAQNAINAIPRPPPLYLSAIPKENSPQAYVNLLPSSSNHHHNKHAGKQSSILPKTNCETYLANWHQTLVEAEKKKSKCHLGTQIMVESIYVSVNQIQQQQQRELDEANSNTNKTGKSTSSSLSSFAAPQQKIEIPEEAFAFRAGGRIPRFEECYFRLFAMLCAAQVGHFELGAMPSGQAAFESKGDVCMKELEFRMKEEAEILQAIATEKKQLLSIVAGSGASSVGKRGNNNNIAAGVAVTNNNNPLSTTPTDLVMSKQALKQQKLQEEKRLNKEQREAETLHGAMTISPHVITLPYIAPPKSSNDDDMYGGGGGGAVSPTSTGGKTVGVKVPAPTMSVTWVLPKLATPNRPTLAVLPANGSLQLKEAVMTVTSFEVRTVRGQTILPFTNKTCPVGEYVFGYFTDSRPEHLPVLTSDKFKVVQAAAPR
jgi:hypothetical protein